MTQTALIDFAYEMAADSAGMKLALSVFSDLAQVREQVREDSLSAGLAIRHCGSFSDAFGPNASDLGEIIYLDCPEYELSKVASLTALDQTLARRNSAVFLSASLDSIGDYFSAFSESNTRFFVNPNSIDLAMLPRRNSSNGASWGVRELSEDDRIYLLRISEQVSKLAEKLDRTISLPGAHNIESEAASVFSFGVNKSARCEMVRATRPPLPDPRLVRRIIGQRQMREKFFDGDLFADPAWDMLLDLTAARAEHVRVSVTSLCIASGVPPTTALRWISQMTEAGLLERIEDETDRRRAFIQLSEKASDAMARYFHELGKAAAQMV